jgi:hypothetical protein
MLVNVTPSRKAPPGRLRFGVGAMALVTAFPVAARGSHADNSAEPCAADPHSAHAGGVVSSTTAAARRRAVPRGAAGRRRRGAQAGREAPGLGWQCFGGTGAAGAEVEGGRGVGGHPGRLLTTKGRTEASRRRMPLGYHTTQTPEERLT